jgi:tetratricopeptide (TPR) repeat protein
MATKRYSGKKSLKQPDEFITFSSRLLQKTIEYRNQIIGVLAAIVVMVAVFSAVSYFSQKSEAQSLLMLSQAIAQYETIQDASGDIEAYNDAKETLQNVIDTYGNKSGGKFATFFLANCSFAAGDFETAETLYRKSVTDFKGVDPFETLAQSSLGYTLAQKGDHEGAAAIFAKLAKEDSDLMTDEVLFALTRQYEETGNAELENETAKKLIETYPESIFSNVIQEKYSTLTETPV